MITIAMIFTRKTAVQRDSTFEELPQTFWVKLAI